VHHLELDVRVGHLVGGHNAIDDCRPVDLERCVDLGVQLAGLRRPESMTAACPRQRREIGIGEASLYGGKPTASASSGISPNAELL